MISNSLKLDQGNEHFDVAKKYLLSGTGAPPRIYPLIGRPLYLERADGPYLYDLDGNRFYFHHNEPEHCNNASLLLLQTRQPHDLGGYEDSEAHR